MDEQTKNKLFAAWAWCDHEDKSTEFMLQFMANEANVEYNFVVDFLVEDVTKEREQWYKDNPSWLKDWEKSHILHPTEARVMTPEEVGPDFEKGDLVSRDEMVQLLLTDIKNKFFDRLDKKTGWGKEQIKLEYLEAQIDALKLLADSLL